MKKYSLLTALAISTAIASPAFAADNAANKASPAAQEFVKKAAASGEFEIQASKIALEKSKNEDVRDLAEELIEDHTKASQDLASRLPKAGIDSSVAAKQLDANQQATINNLKSKSGAEFDREFIKAQEQAHKDAVQLFSNYSKNGDNAELKDFASDTLPTLEEHREEAADIRVDNRSAAKAERVNNDHDEDHDDDDHDDKDHDDKH